MKISIQTEQLEEFLAVKELTEKMRAKPFRFELHLDKVILTSQSFNTSFYGSPRCEINVETTF